MPGTFSPSVDPLSTLTSSPSGTPWLSYSELLEREENRLEVGLPRPLDLETKHAAKPSGLLGLEAVFEARRRPSHRRYRPWSSSAWSSLRVLPRRLRFFLGTR